MTSAEPVHWASGMSLLDDVGAAQWVATALTASADSRTVASLVPSVFPTYARLLPPTYPGADGEQRYRWTAVAAGQGVPLTAETRFDDLAAGSDRWGRPIDGGLERKETEVLARILSRFTATPDRAYFCLWDGSGMPEINAWWDRPARVHTPYRDYHLLTGPLSAAGMLPELAAWTCANLWWPADRAWLVATEIDGFLTYIGGSENAIAAVLSEPDLDAVPAQPATPLDPSYG